MSEETHPNIIQRNSNSNQVPTGSGRSCGPKQTTDTCSGAGSTCILIDHGLHSRDHTPLAARALAAHDRRITPFKSPPQEPAFSSAPDALAVAPVVRKTRISLQRPAPSRRFLPVAPDVQIGTTILRPHSSMDCHIPTSSRRHWVGSAMASRSHSRHYWNSSNCWHWHASLLWNKWKLIKLIVTWHLVSGWISCFFLPNFTSLWLCVRYDVWAVMNCTKKVAIISSLKSVSTPFTLRHAPNFETQPWYDLITQRSYYK